MTQGTEELTKIETVEQMGQLVVGWHFNALRQLDHVLNMPPEAGVDIPTGEVDENGVPVFIDGNEDHKAGFLAGIQYCLDEIIGNFPIKGQVDESNSETNQ